jgi:hypothetical protein
VQPFPGFLIAGFESAGQRLRDGTRFDLCSATDHDRLLEIDYASVRVRGMRTVREGARWHVIEQRPWRYEFGALRPMVRTARQLGLRVIWTLLDRGWPDDVDLFRPAFVRRFTAFAAAFAKFLHTEGDDAPVIIPIHEISSLAWLGGETARIDPYREERGFELQCQLVRAATAAADAVRTACPDARICCAEPLYHVSPQRNRPQDLDLAMAINGRRFRTMDMLTGRIWPQLGGEGRHLDIVGATFYPESEWYYNGPKFPGPAIPCGAPGWRPLRELLRELSQRYARPLFIAGTGDNGARSVAWLRHVGRETRAAMFADSSVLGVCLNPALGCPRSPGERRAVTGLWSPADPAGERPLNHALAEELALQQACFDRLTESLAPRSTANAALLRPV